MKKNIEIQTTSKDLTHLTGLYFFQDIIKRTNLVNRLSTFLPQAMRKSSHPPKDKFILGVFAFICGAECIDDLDWLKREYLFSNLMNGGFSSSTMWRFMGSLKLKHFEKLQNFLSQFALDLRQKHFPKDNKIIIAMDATPHIQHGQYMQGVTWNYKNDWCLSSQNAFDEKGFCYGWNLMPGNKHTSTGAAEMIEKVFKNIPETMDRYFRADSGYANIKIYNSLITKNIKFGICLPETSWGILLKNNQYKLKWEKTKIRFFDSPKCKISSCDYQPKNLKKRHYLRVVFIRAPKKKIDKNDKYNHRYYAIVTNMSADEMSNEEVIRFYRGRANCENFIKDLKNGVDFKHFPCQSLNRNKTWGFMGIFAYNLLRFASFLIDKKRGCFIKRTRLKMLFLASEIRKGQRKIKLRISKNIFKEVKRLEQLINNLNPKLPLHL